MSASTQFFGVRYGKVAEVVVAHTYYDQEYCPHISLSPSAATATMLRQYRLQWLATPQGGRILAPNPPIIALPTAPVTLEFYLRASDPEFLSVTALGTGQRVVGSYRFVYEGEGWVNAAGEPMGADAVPGVVAVLQVQFTLDPNTPQTVRLTLDTPDVEWRYYVVTGNDYVVNDLLIAANNQVVSTPANTPSPEWPDVMRRFADRRVTALQIQHKLLRDFPAWYLVTPNANGVGVTHVADVPPIPKPRPGALPHLILDYSSILK